MRFVHGIGINDANYIIKKAITIDGADGKRVQKVLWKCPYYVTWANMIKRCYCPKFQSTELSYVGCTVYEEWLTFSNFKAWMETQDWEGKQLDKDLLVKGNKIYSPETCIFISKKLNTFINESVSRNNGLAQGVSYDKDRNKFKAQVNNPFITKNTFLGRYDSEIEAHKAWGVSKLKFACMLADREPCEKIKKALIMRYIEFKEDWLHDPIGSQQYFEECLIKWENKQ